VKTLSMGKIRGMQQISTSTGRITVLALDQRGSTENLGIPKGDPALYETLRDFKLGTVNRLAGYASAVLLDPEYGAHEAVARGILPGNKGLIVTLEESGYINETTARLNRIIPGWSIRKAKKMGASAVKLLVHYNPYALDLAETQDRFIRAFVTEAQEEDIPLLIEPVSYSTDPAVAKDSQEFAAQRPEMVVETARRIGALGVEMLKMEFPYDAKFNADEQAWETACQKITQSSMVPWALLSAGVDFEVFKRQALVACKSGASGFVAGRAIWKEATLLRGAQRDSFLASTGCDRLAELADNAEKYARPWTTLFPGLASAATREWYKSFSEEA